jgi:hypothetical protein
MPYFSKQQPRSTMNTKINNDQQNLSPFSNTRLSSMPKFKLYNKSYANFSLFMTVWPSLVKDTQLFTGEKDTYILLPQTIVDTCIHHTSDYIKISKHKLI